MSDAPLQPLRGEVWDARLPVVGRHPAVVLTVNPLIPRLGAVTVAVVTGTAGPSSTHVRLDADAGLTRYPESYVNATDLHTLSRTRLQQRRGRLAAGELAHLEDAVRLYLGL
ncbi:MAG: type II toxin-antitoxin system PemK/MazF family toxin [Pseudonocardiaceae bacterium]